MHLYSIPQKITHVIKYTSAFSVLTCPVRPARVVVKLTSVMTEAASGGISGAGLRVVRNKRNSVL